LAGDLMYGARRAGANQTRGELRLNGEGQARKGDGGELEKSGKKTFIID